MNALIVTNPFGGHDIGHRITDPGEIEAVLSGENARDVVASEHAESTQPADVVQSQHADAAKAGPAPGAPQANTTQED